MDAGAMNHACSSFAAKALVAALATASVAHPARADSDSTVDLEMEYLAEVEGRDASLALLEFVMDNHAAQSCGAKRGKVVLSEASERSFEGVTTDQRSIPESDVLELARSLPENENVFVMYHCEVTKESFRGRAVFVLHAAYEDKAGWKSSIMRLRSSLAPEEAPPTGLTEVDVAHALAEASRQMNAVSPVVAAEGVRLDSTEVEGRALIFNFTFINQDAAEVKGRKVRRAAKPKVVAAVCDDEKQLTLFRDGVHYEYRYRGKDGERVTTITLSLKDCE